jgi:hypothetical protein
MLDTILDWFNFTSFADPGCLSRIQDPDFFHPDPGSNKKRGGHKFHKIEKYIIF